MERRPWEGGGAVFGTQRRLGGRPDAENGAAEALRRRIALFLRGLCPTLDVQSHELELHHAGNGWTAAHAKTAAAIRTLVFRIRRLNATAKTIVVFELLRAFSTPTG